MAKSKEKDTDWALILKQHPIHIDLAESGRNNYFCLGCRKEVIAVKQTKNPHWQSYFRHYAKDVNRDLAECVVASRQYRERIAEQILHRLKKLKVPAVIKYSPRGIEGAPMLLQEPQEIIAHRVRAQLSFYEDENGDIKRGKNPDLKDRYLLIRPDVTFFDANDKPILFIEFVITHKLDIEKKIKLARLGIDTVQIIIPKKPEPEIEKILTSSRAIKWVYNAKEANTEYIPPASGNSGGIYELDEDQRKLFKNHSGADQTKLEILYGQLNDVIDQNRTEELNETLTRKYRELRKLEKELNRDWQTWKKELEEKSLQESKTDLESRWKRLKEWKKSTRLIADAWKKDTENWKANITEKKTNLQRKRQLLKKNKETLANLSEEVNMNNLEKLKEILEKNLQQQRKSLTEKSKKLN